jgi:hypothetical protein
MAKSQIRKASKGTPKRSATANLDLDPDAWPRFEALIKSAAKMGHKPHETPAPKKRKARKG